MDRIIKRSMAGLVVVWCLALLTTSCIKEEQKDCNIDITFDYSYNMLSTNAFGNQVDQVSVYVFEEGGTLAWKYESRSGEVEDSGFSVGVSNLPNGTYRFAAWAQSTRLSDENAFFRVPDLKVGVSRLEELTYFLKRTDATQQAELNNLLVGVTEPITIGKVRPKEVKVGMKKVNNRIRVVLLPETGGNNLDVNNFTFTIEDNIGNGFINYDYSLLEDEAITYFPYFKANILPDPSEVLNPDEIDRAAVVEINTSRLMEAHVPRLKIRLRDSESLIANINLPRLFSLTKMENHSEWSLQEYLDRQDEYSITLYFNPGNWMAGRMIIINGWVVNDINIDF